MSTKDLYTVKIKEAQEKFLNLRLEIFQLLYNTNSDYPEPELRQIKHEVDKKVDALVRAHHELVWLYASPLPD